MRARGLYKPAFIAGVKAPQRHHASSRPFQKNKNRLQLADTGSGSPFLLNGRKEAPSERLRPWQPDGVSHQDSAFSPPRAQEAAAKITPSPRPARLGCYFGTSEEAGQQTCLTEEPT